MKHMDKVTIGPAKNDSAPPLSQGVINYSPQLFISGQLGLDPTTGRLVTTSTEAQIRQAFANFAAVVQSASEKEKGTTLADVLKMNIYLADMAHYPTVNSVMRDYFGHDGPFPARSAIGVASLNGAVLEIDGVVQLRSY